MAGIKRGGGVFGGGGQWWREGLMLLCGLALSASQQKPNESSTNVPKITSGFYLSPQIELEWVNVVF